MVPEAKVAKFAIWDGEYQLYLNVHDDGISRVLAARGRREEQLRALLEEELRPGMCVFDLGANIGYYAIWEALRVGPTGKVYGIEPNPENFALLQRNIALNGLNGRIETWHLGAADFVGETEMFLADYSNLHSFYAKQFRGRDKGHLSGKSIKVPVTTVSEFARGKRRIELIRMDIEGYELEVIDGMEAAFREDPEFAPTIVFETHFPKYDDTLHSLRERLRRLFDRGYRVAKVSSNDEAKSQPLRDLGYRPYRTVIAGDATIQGLYADLANADAERLLCDLGGIRDVVLKKGGAGPSATS